MSESAVVAKDHASGTFGKSTTWQRTYMRQAEIADLAVAILGVIVAVGVRFGDHVSNNKAPQDVTVVRTGPDSDKLMRGPQEPELRRGRKYLAAYIGVMGPQEALTLLCGPPTW